MRSENWRIQLPFYMAYKFFNSLFLGLSVGTIFAIYTPLEPSVYSLGGIALALAMLAVARFYPVIMTLGWFFAVSLSVEMVVLGMVCGFLTYPYRYTTALLVYIGYQTTFAFGSYLVRAETLALENDENLSRVDTLKQLGYLTGMGISWVFYRILEHFGITSSKLQVYHLHWLLLGVEILIIVLILGSFRHNSRR